MFLHISYLEIQSFAKEHKHIITISYVNERTIKVCKKMMFFGIEQTVDINLRIDAVEGNNLVLAHDNATFVKSVMQYIELCQPEYLTLLRLRPDNTVALRMDQIPQLREVLEHKTLNSLGFSESGVTLGIDTR
jgi:hypothetical protein